MHVAEVDFERLIKLLNLYQPRNCTHIEYNQIKLAIDDLYPEVDHWEVIDVLKYLGILSEPDHSEYNDGDLGAYPCFSFNRITGLKNKRMSTNKKGGYMIRS